MMLMYHASYSTPISSSRMVTLCPGLTLVHFSSQPEPLLVIKVQQASTSRLNLKRFCL
jgi:hypothetical protein